MTLWQILLHLLSGRRCPICHHRTPHWCNYFDWYGDGSDCDWAQCGGHETSTGVIIGLAQRAVLAGLASDFAPSMQKRFSEASEKHREDHEKSLGRPIGTVNHDVTHG